jgi:hypothetical protein
MPGKVLIILSDAHAFAVTKSDGTVVEEETGFFLMELAKPLAKLLDAGYEVTVRVHDLALGISRLSTKADMVSLHPRKASSPTSTRSPSLFPSHSSGCGGRRTRWVARSSSLPYFH